MTESGRGHSLTQRIAVTAGGLALAVTLVIGTGSFIVLWNLVVDRVQFAVRADANAAAKEVSRLLASSADTLDGLARNTLVANALVDSVGRDAYLLPFLRGFDRINRIGGDLILTDYAGRPIAQSRPTAFDVKAMPWIRAVIDTGRPNAAVQDIGGVAHLVMAEPVIYANTGTPEGALVLALPVRNVALDSEGAGLDGVAHFLEFQGVAGRWRLGPGDLPRRPRVETIDTPIPELPPLLAPLVPHLASEVDAETVEGPLRDLIVFYGASGIAVILCVIPFSLFLSHRISRPLARLAEVAAGVRVDRIPSAIELGPDTDLEIAEVASVLNGMIHRLGDAYAELEKRNRVLLRNAETVAGVGSWRLLAADGRMEWSERTFQVLGRSADLEPTFDRFLGSLHEDDRRAVRAAILESGEGVTATIDARTAGPTAERILRILVLGGADDARSDGTVLDVTEQVMATRRLEESERRYREIAATVPGVVFQFLVPPDGEPGFAYVSPRSLDIFGLDPEVLRADWQRFPIHPDDRCRWFASIDEVMRSGREWAFEGRYLRPGGTVHWFKGASRPVGTDRGLVFNGILVDVSSERQALDAAERARERLALATRSARIGIWDFDVASGSLAWDDAMFAICGLDRAAFRGRLGDWRALVHTDDLELVDHAVPRALSQGGHLDVRFRIRRPDGAVRHMEVLADTITAEPPHRAGTGSGKVARMVGVARDITESVEAESIIRRQAEELKRSNAELEAFAYVASHDLRQPLRTVSSYMTLLERRLGERLDADEREFLDFAVGGAKRMDALIVGLLEYSRIGRKERPPEPVSLAEVVADSLALLNLAIREAGATVEVAPGLPEITGDRMEMVRLFQNLVGNAVKYRAPDRPPVVAVDWTETPKEWVVTVRDNGIGIAPKDHARVFGIFQRLVTREEYEGTGIGLAVCRKIAEHHGGRIWVDSEEGQGAAFRIAFPKSWKGWQA